MPKSGRGAYPLVADIRWIINFWQEKAKNLDISTKVERQRLLKVKADELEFEYKKKKKEYLPAAETEKALINIFSVSRNKILGLKSLIAPLLKEFVDDPEQFGIVIEKVDNLVRDVLMDLSNASKK